MDNLIPEIQPVNADSLFPRIIEEGQTRLRRWGEQRMIRLYDEAMDDLLDRERYDVYGLKSLLPTCLEASTISPTNATSGATFCSLQ